MLCYLTPSVAPVLTPPFSKVRPSFHSLFLLRGVQSSCFIGPIFFLLIFFYPNAPLPTPDFFFSNPPSFFRNTLFFVVRESPRNLIMSLRFSFPFETPYVCRRPFSSSPPEDMRATLMNRSVFPFFFHPCPPPPPLPNKSLLPPDLP